MPSGSVHGLGQGRYSALVAAIVESALVTWFGLLLFGIANVAPHGRITVSLPIHCHKRYPQRARFADPRRCRIRHGLHPPHILCES